MATGWIVRIDPGEVTVCRHSRAGGTLDDEDDDDNDGNDNDDDDNDDNDNDDNDNDGNDNDNDDDYDDDEKTKKKNAFVLLPNETAQKIHRPCKKK